MNHINKYNIKIGVSSVLSFIGIKKQIVQNNHVYTVDENIIATIKMRNNF